MKITTCLFIIAAIVSMSLPSWALRGVKEGGGDDAVVLHCYALSKAKIEIVGLNYEDSDLVELRVFENKKLKVTDYGIWSSSSATYIGYHFELNLLEKKFVTKNELTLLGQTSFSDLTCVQTPL